MSELIDRLMDVAEAEAGTMKLDAQRLDLREIVESAVDLYEFVAEEKEIALEIAGAGAPVLGDRTRLRQVFANLLDNAIKFSPRGGRVRISLDTRGNEAMVKIQDDGPGVAPGDVDRIWDRLYRGDYSRSTPGLGLGLSIVRAVIRAHGGQAILERSPGAGACFVVTLPIAS
jgi:signal transduction histidine kinase